MSVFFSQWWHHSHNFPVGLAFGLPLFAWNRIAKLFLFMSALPILVEIVGVERVEHGFHGGRERLLRADIRCAAWSGRVIKALESWIGLLLVFFRALVGRKRPEASLPTGRAPRALGIVCLVLLGVAAFASFVFVFLPVLFLDMALLPKLLLSVALTMFVFLTLWVIPMAFLFAVTVLLRLAGGAVLKFLLLSISCLLRLTGRIHEKGAVHSWRLASVGLLCLGFVLDLLTS